MISEHYNIHWLLIIISGDDANFDFSFYIRMPHNINQALKRMLSFTDK